MTEAIRDVCMMCGCKEPAGGWHISGCSDGDVEHFCSDKCFNESCDYHDDADDEINSREEDCGRWVNGRLSLQCSKAGSEECDWECPIGLPLSSTDREGHK